MAPPDRMTDKMISFAPLTEAGMPLRRAFGEFGTGVTIVTARTERGPLGMTANSFTSVSLNPPLVLWSAATRSKRHDAFTEAAHFCIHVLGQGQRALAHHFATDGEDFEGVSWQPGPEGVPELAGCRALFHCRAYATHPAGDHTMILGEVTHASHAERVESGLLFHQGGFGGFAGEDPED
ncbi:MAG: flavin reductase family protein [Sulfitobacter sp.]|nr:flavin reductase family protein [Sulfitobacter sp.]